MASATLMTSTPHPLDPDALSSGARLVSNDDRPLPLRGTEMEASAKGGIARVILRQRFVNPHDEPLLVSYHLPLPAGGAVSAFRFEIDDRVVKGEIDRKQRARERFEEAIARGQTAALLEQQRPNQFMQRVGNVPPHAEIVCEVEVDQKLTWIAEGAWEWRFPTVVGPRYMGAPGRVADAADLNVALQERDTGVRAALTLVIGDRLADGHRPVSPSHVLAHDAVGSRLHVRFDTQGGVRLDRDVVVRWRVATAEVGVDLELYRPAQGRHAQDAAFGLLSLVPPAPTTSPAALPRDLIFLVDTSGSMGGAPLDQAKRVMCAMIDSLGDADQLELIEFGSVPKRWQKEPTLATREGKRAATTWVKRLQASGGTEMRDAIVEALTPLRQDAQRQIVLITDGYIGFENEIVRLIHQDLPKGSRLHTLGVGSAPNLALIGPAARAGGGVDVMLGLGEDVEPGAKRLLERTCAPILTEVTIEGAGVEVRPARLPDVFAGSPLRVSLAVPADGTTLTVRGLTADGPWQQSISVPKTARGQGQPGVAALFGREWIEDLEARRSSCERARDAEAIDAEVESVALRFQLSSRCTSWIAIDELLVVEPGTNLRREEMPHEVPHGLSVSGLGLRAPTGAVPTLAAPAAPAAMGAAKRSRPMLDRETQTAAGRMRGAAELRKSVASEERTKDADEPAPEAPEAAEDEVSAIYALAEPPAPPEEESLSDLLQAMAGFETVDEVPAEAATDVPADAPKAKRATEAKQEPAQQVQAMRSMVFDTPPLSSAKRKKNKKLLAWLGVLVLLMTFFVLGFCH